jgi:agmatinase
MQKINKVQPGTVAIVGIPFDENSSFLKGAASAPRYIREAFHSQSSNTCTESVMDLSREPRLLDLGDLEINDYIDDIRQPVSTLLEKGAKVLSLGGDHSVTYPILKAYGKAYERLSILQLDAHPDLYQEYEGNRYAHGCPFARIMEENLADRLVQVGVRTMNPHQQQQADRFNVEIIDMKQWYRRNPGDWFKPAFAGPVYLSLDMDVLDPAFAPGLSHYEPGGLSSRDVLGIIQDLEAPLVGADIVELNPKRDIHNMTAMAAAKFLKEIVEKMLKFTDKRE